MMLPWVLPFEIFQFLNSLIAGIKLEAGSETIQTASFLTQRGIPVVSHLGLLPQRFNQNGGIKVQRKSSSEKSDLIKLAKENEAAGESLLLVEGVKEDLARSIVCSVNISSYRNWCFTGV